MATAQTTQIVVDHCGPDDLSLIRRITHSDHQAFAVLYQRYVSRLTSYLRTILNSPEQIEDIVHDVLMVVWQQAAQYQGTASVSTWLFGIARNKAHQAHVRETRRSYSPAPIPEPTEVTDPERQILEQEDGRLIRQAFDTLSSTQQELLRLTYEHSYSVQAIATRQDCSTGTVHYRKKQAYRRLVSQLVGE